MPEFSLIRSGVWIRAFDGTKLTGAITTSAGWIDASDVVRGRVSFDPTRSFVRLEPQPPRTRGILEPADSAGSFSMQFLRITGADNVADFFNDIESSVEGKFQVLVNQFKDDSGRPVASASNPQYQSTIGMTGFTPWSQTGRQTAISNVSGELDSDYGVYTS